MSQVQYPDYLAFDSLLRQHGLALSPAELHGLVSGILAGGVSAQAHAWQPLLNEYTNEGQAWPHAAQQAVSALVQASSDEMKAQQFQFTLLMPDDEENLMDRADALAEWVNHFLSGLGLANIDPSNMSAEAKEVLADLEEIAKLGIDEDDDLEEQSMLFEQVTEHVKVCVLTLALELAGPEQGAQQPTLH
ncbi:hypothetical protein VST7929_00460 [Vibrio stylophorae]|uniref:UPF0149 protein VST7929_00460 n=1 Tax=Vibrio stylophorae TaxID=659351 RepID=A0ABN8DRM9_9VIBR|nr:YecA family protein [Vibrio stylophorae]CAH0532620.1 hypothetical protein VST7929_00460 [Vibrio stylophorae]